MAKKSLSFYVNEQAKIERDRLNKLVDEMAESHFLRIIDEDEQDDFLSELARHGFHETAKRIESERSASTEDFIRRITVAAENE